MSPKKTEKDSKKRKYTANNNQSKLVPIRIKWDDYEMIKNAADTQGETFSDYVRNATRERLIDEGFIED